MKKLKKSIKAIIISICAVVVLAGSIVGVVLANKNKNDNPPAGNGGASVVKNEFVGAQVDLMKSINSNKQEIKTVEKIDNDLISASGLDLNQISEISDYYISAKSSDGIDVYLYSRGENNNYQFIKLENCLNIQESYESFNSLMICNNYVLFTYKYAVNYITYQKVGIAKIVNEFEVVLINDLIVEYLEDSKIKVNDLVCNSFDVKLQKGYYYFYYQTENLSNTYNCLIYEYTDEYVNNDSVTKIENLNSENAIKFSDYYYTIDNANSIEYGVLYNEHFYKFTLEKENEVLYNYTLIDNRLFIEEKVVAENLVDLTDEYVYDEESRLYLKHSYKIYNIVTGQFENIVFEQNVVKVTYGGFISNEYVYFFEQSAENYILNAVGLVVYYNFETFEKILCYSTDSVEDVVIYSNHNSILTNSGIFKVKNGLVENVVYSFKDNTYEIFTKNFCSNNFLIYSSSLNRYKVMNMSGEIVFDKNFVSAYEYENGIYLVKDENKNVYRLNLNNLSLTIVENFELSNLNNSLAFVGFGAYVAGADNYCLYDYMGNVVERNIVTYNLLNLSKDMVLELNLSNNKKSYFLKYGVQFSDNTISVGQDDEINLISNIITPYGDSDGGTSKYYTKNSVSCGSVTLSNYSEYTLYTVSTNKGFLGDDGYITSIGGGLGDAGFKWYTDRANGKYGAEWENDVRPRNDDFSGQCSGEWDSSVGGMTLKYRMQYYNNFSWKNACGNFDNDETNTMNVSCVTFTITLNKQSGSGGSDSISQTYSSSITSSISVPSRTGYTFGGYYTSTGGGGTQVYDASGACKVGSTQFTSHATIYAKWTGISYNISYDYVGGTKGSSNPATATYGSSFTVSHPSRVGYTFSGWTVTGKSGLQTATSYSNLTTTAGATVYFTANWTANTYTIKFTNIVGSVSVTKNTGSSSPSSVSVSNNGTTTLSYAPEGGTYDTSISNPSKTGYTFTGWTISNMSTDCRHCWGGYARGSNETDTGVKATTGYLNLRSTSGTVTFTAAWTANTYSIKYVLGGGVKVTGKEYPTSGTYDTQFKVDEPIRTGYTFTGWSLSNCGNTCDHYYGSSSASTKFTTTTLTNKKGPYFKNLRATSGEVTFTAVWSANTYTIAFAMNNPNSVTDDISSWSSVTATYDTAKTLTGTPTKTGYIFSHWNISGMDEKSSVTGDIITHKHRANSSASWTSFTGTTLNSITLPRDFLNLRSTSGTVTFTAQWTPITYNLTYDANGGRFNSDINNPTSATYDLSFNVTTPVRHGYNFTSWTIQVNNGAGQSYTETVNYPNTSTDSFINRTTTNGATVKFTANWAAVTYNINFDYASSTNTNDSTTATFASWKNIANPKRMGYLFDYWEITGTSACGHTANCGCFTSADSGTCSHYYNTSNSDTGATRFTGESLANCTATYYKNLHCTQGGTVTFKAHWIKKTYNVINAGAVYGATISTEYPKYDDVFSMTAPTSAPTGYHFNGWTITGANDKDENTNQTVTHIYGTTSSPSSTFTGTSKTVGKTVMYFKNLSSNHWTSSSSTAAIVTITPVWAENTYTITFDMNNPNRVTNDITSMSNITAYYDTAYNVANPTKAGYTFEGWSLSGLTTDCTHYYGNSSSSMTAFSADPSGAYKDSGTAQYVLLKNTYYKNLRSEEGNAVLKANWKAVTYTITYHYIPASFNVANYNSSQLFTHVVIPKNMTQTITKQVVYDTKYEAIDAKNELGEVIFPLPAGLKFKLWTISDSVLGNNVQIAKYNSSNVVVTNLSDSIMPGEKRIYGPGKDSDGELTWKHYSKDIHLYACYDLAGINLRYYGPSAASGENDLSKYSNLPAVNTNVKYTEFIRFASHAAVVDGINLMGWMISADYFSSGKLTEQSVTVFEYKSEKYIAYQGTQAYWNYTNVDAYSYEDPTYFLYAVYSSDYSGSTHALNFTYRDNSSGSFGAMHSAKFYSVKGTDDSITTVKIPKIYNDGANGWWPVELIDADGFKGYTKLTSATWFNTMRRLDDYAFSGCTKLATFTLNEGLHTIGAYAFNGCTIITSISTPSTLRVVGNHAFRNCINVSSLSLNTGLLTIGDYAFYNLPKVTSLSLPSTLVGKIGTYAFYYIQMASVTIPKGVTTIGYGCFYQCTKLATITFAEGSSLKKIERSAFDSTIITSINIPNSVTQIDHNAFYSCSKLATVTLPDSLTTLGTSVFYNCSELTAVTVPKGLTSIPNNTFYGCAKLNSVIIYNGITSIGDQAFYNCSSLTSLTIPNSVTSIGSSALYGCSKLATLSVPFVGKSAATTTASEYIFGYIFGASSSTQAGYIPSTLKTVHITNATKVDASAFNGLTMLTHLYINKGVTSIGQNAFNGCTGLVELSIPFIGTSSTDTTYNFLGYFFGQTTVKTSSTKVPSTLKTVHVTNATSIGYCAFYYAPVTTVNLNEGITSIGQYAFSNSKITGINLPRTVTTIENYAFYYASDLATVNFNEGLTSIGEGSFWESKISTVVIPQTVTTIGTYAFRNCDSITTLVLFDGLTTLSSGAFAYCNNITSVKIPKTVTTLSDSCFRTCLSLTSVILHDSITSIGAAAFSGCKALKSISIPSSVTSIGVQAFFNSGLTSIVIPKSVTSIGHSAFYDCKSLTSAKLSNAITEIKHETFVGTAITRIEIPASVTTIGYGAFQDCTALVDVVCHGAVQSFSISSTQPFYGCSALSYFYYGGSESYFNTTPMQSNSYTYSDLNDGASTFTMIYNFDHMEFTYHNGYYSFKSKGTPSDSDFIAIPSTYDDGVHGRYDVTVIEEKAFYSKTGTYSVSLPSTITTIGDYAFYNCPYMSTVNLPSNLTSIGDYAFYNCVYTKASFTIPKNVEYIGPYTFYYCAYLGFQFASNSKLRYIGEYAFYNVGAFTATADQYKFAIPDGVTYIGDYAFYNSAHLFKDDLKLPSGLLYLGRYSFGFCHDITRVELPRTLDSLNELTFYYCSDLRVVYLPSTLKSISARSYSVSPFYYAGANSTTAPNISIYVEGEGIPSGWGTYWNYVNSGKKANTFFNYPKMPNAYLSNLSTTYPMVQDDEGTFKLDLTSKVSSSTSLGLRIDANYFVNVRFEYMIYGTSASNDMCVEMNGTEYPVSLLGNQTTTYQYFSRLMAPGEYMKIMFSNANGSASAGMYIKNLRIEPIERYGTYDFSYSKSGATTTLTSTNQNVNNSSSGFTYYATEHCEVSFAYKSDGEASWDFVLGYLNGVQVFNTDDHRGTKYKYSEVLKPGDYLSIYYYKDGSNSYSPDAGYFYNFYVAKISEYAYEAIDVDTLMSTSNSAYKNAYVSESFDQPTQWSNFHLSTIPGWEQLYKRIRVTKYNAVIRMHLFTVGTYSCSPSLENSSVTSYKTLVGPFVSVNVNVPNGANPQLGTAVAYGCFLPSKYRTTVVTLTIPEPGDYYLTYDFGGYLDDQYIVNDISCIESIGVESFIDPYFDSAFDNWSNATTKCGSFTRYYYPNTYPSYYSDGSIFLRSGNKERASTTSTLSYVAPDDGLITFNFYVYSEGSCDYLKVYLNGTQIMYRTGTTNTTGNYAIAVSRGDIVKFSYRKDGSVDKGDDCAEIRNFRFKKCAVFKSNGSGGYISTNNGNQSSECVYVVHGNFTYNGATSTKSITFTINSELIHDRVEIYNQAGECIYTTKNSANTSHTVSLSCSYTTSNYFLIKYIKDGSINSSSEGVTITSVS